jgi:hypothetical protein
MLAKMNANVKSNQDDLLARMEAKIETNRETDREERKAESKNYQEDLKKIMEEMLRANQNKMDAWLTEKQVGRKETTTCHKTMEADTEKTEPDLGMMQSIGEHQEVPKEEAAVMPVGGLRKEHRDQNVAARSRKEESRQVGNHE